MHQDPLATGKEMHHQQLVERVDKREADHPSAVPPTRPGLAMDVRMPDSAVETGSPQWGLVPNRRQAEP
jgi:hypothetical protein